tara:strand:+ start:407 stop:787 length:381 start_codon:yes stop_codon:yes gene_type:complete
MAVTHTWSVNNQLQTRTQDGLSEVVFSVVWNLYSEETVDGTTYRISSANQISLNTDNLDPATYTAFADLTEDQVVGWAKDQIDANAAEGQGVVCAEWEAGHDRNIAKQINPPTAVETAPWVTSDPV